MIAAFFNFFSRIRMLDKGVEDVVWFGLCGEEDIEREMTDYQMLDYVITFVTSWLSPLLTTFVKDPIL